MEEAFSVLKVLEVCGGRLFLWPGSYSGPSDLRKISWSRHVFLADLLAERKLLGDGLHLDTFYLSDHRILKRPGKVCLNLVAEAYSDIPQRKKLLVVGTNSGAEALSDIPH